MMLKLPKDLLPVLCRLRIFRRLPGEPGTQLSQPLTTCFSFFPRSLSFLGLTYNSPHLFHGAIFTMAPRISLFSRALKMGAKQNSVQARITKAMCHTVESASEENERLNDENERLRLRNYELKRELEEVYRKLWETEIERG